MLVRVIHFRPALNSFCRVLVLCAALCLPAAAPLAAQPAHPNTGAELRIIGGLSGGNVYLSYLALEAIARNFSCGNYSEGEALTLTNSLDTVLEKTVESLRNAQALPGLSDEDYAFLAETIDTYAVLQAQADYLKAYTASLSQDDLNLFLNAKQKSWEKIQKLLGLGG